MDVLLLLFSFLDKVYCLSSAEAMEKFLKNPRPYLLPPQPRPPCKISVLGAPYAGKTTFCHLLAQKYGSKVCTRHCNRSGGRDKKRYCKTSV